MDETKTTNAAFMLNLTKLFVEGFVKGAVQGTLAGLAGIGLFGLIGYGYGKIFDLLD